VTRESTERSRDLVIIGGGPAGSTAAAIAAKRGLDVLLLEAGTHPRPHVGESLLPGILPILDEMGALEAVRAAGFREKTGSTHWDWGATPRWDLWLADSEAYDHAWLVERNRFDTILFESAARAGARTELGARCEAVLYEDGRAVGVRYRKDEREHEARARFVIDASGQAGLIARDKALREPIEGLQHLAAWAHWEGCGYLPPPRDRQAWFLASPTCWTWMFPFGGGRASIGLVTLDGRTTDYDALIASDARLTAVLGPEARRASPVRWERDWSYRHIEIAGPGWLSAGDAAGFIDPVLSTGVLLAMHAGWAAARTVAEVKAGRDEAEALADYTRGHRKLFGDLLRIVRFFYERTLANDDYFWQAKAILRARDDMQLKPQRAFVVLTSGLVGNLAFDDRRARVDEARLARTERGTDLSADLGEAPSQLGFVCVALSCELAAIDRGEGHAKLYLLLEPSDAASPALFRTPRFDLTCLAPRLDNDPIRVPALAPLLREAHELVRSLDDDPSASVADLWRRLRAPLEALVARWPAFVTLDRVFGE
jgi:flavin-dependent dehydrogenase